uniref:Sfi1 spindle body domain-containing protein n=1 Tax=Clastoptera arizonana TaxID=38151 RepID=A0A1B6DHS4_9HEMI
MNNHFEKMLAENNVLDVNKINFIIEKNTAIQLAKKINKEQCHESVPFVTTEKYETERGFITIDKEIEDLKKFLENEKFKFKIFNSKCSKYASKLWKPIEIEAVPMINVTTTLKEHRILLKNNLKSMDSCNICLTPKPIQVTGNAILCLENKRTFNEIVPNNSVRTVDDVIEIGEKEKLVQRKDQENTNVVENSYKKWKSFVKFKNKEKHVKRSTLTANDKKILQIHFTRWKDFWKNIKIEKWKLQRQEIKESKLRELVKTVVVKNKEIKFDKEEMKKKSSMKKRSDVKSFRVKDESEIFENRYKALLKIVAEQKEKLVKQEEVIEKLSEEKILNNLNSFNEISKNEADIALKSYDSRLKVKAKLLKQNSESAIDKSSNKCQTLVRSMTVRAEEISRTKKLAKLKRTAIEVQKQMKEKETEAAKKKEYEILKKMRKIEAEKKKELEVKKSLDAQVKRLEIERMTLIANMHYKNKLLAYVFKGLKFVIKEKEYKFLEACLFYKRTLKKKSLFKLSKFCKESLENKILIADQFYKVSLMHKFWRYWLENHNDFKRKNQVGIDLYELKLQQKAFNRWCVFASQQYLLSCKIIEDARKHYKRHLMQSTLNQWKMFISLKHKHMEQELRRQSWRHKVKEILPDFCPIINDELEI